MVKSRTSPLGVISMCFNVSTGSDVFANVCVAQGALCNDQRVWPIYLIHQMSKMLEIYLIIKQTKYSRRRLIHARLLQPTAYYIQIAWNGNFLIISHYKNSGHGPSISDSPCRKRKLWLDGTAFEKMGMDNGLKVEADGHLRKTFPPKKATLRSFFSAE